MVSPLFIGLPDPAFYSLFQQLFFWTRAWNKSRNRQVYRGVPRPRRWRERRFTPSKWSRSCRPIRWLA